MNIEIDLMTILAIAGLVLELLTLVVLIIMTDIIAKRVKGLKTDIGTLAQFVLKEYQDRTPKAVEVQVKDSPDRLPEEIRPAATAKKSSKTKTKLNTTPALKEIFANTGDQIKAKRTMTQAQKDALAKGRDKRKNNIASKEVTP